MIKAARKQGMYAAYLSVAAIVSALVVACLVTGLVLGLVNQYHSRSYRYGYNNYYG